MAERIVDSLEPVEVEQKDRAAVLAPNRAHERVVKRSAKRFAVREARQRILFCKPIEFDLRLAHFGKVGGEAAEAEETADLVVDGAASD